VPSGALPLWHELHDVGIAVLGGILLKLGPGGIECLISPAEFGEQLALEPGEIVASRRPVRGFPVKIDSTLNPL
jgi:hypothetical protein